MSVDFLDCLKRERDISIKPVLIGIQAYPLLKGPFQHSQFRALHLHRGGHGFQSC